MRTETKRRERFTLDGLRAVLLLMFALAVAGTSKCNRAIEDRLQQETNAIFHGLLSLTVPTTVKDVSRRPQEKN